VFYRNEALEGVKSLKKAVDKTVEETVDKTVDKILMLIRKNPHTTAKEIASKVSLTRRGIEWNLAMLKHKGILKRIGSKKSGYWEVKT